MAHKIKKKRPVDEDTEITAEEQEVFDEIAAQNEENASKVSFQCMEKAVALLETEFNLKDKSYVVTAFTDKSGKVKVSMTNGEFDVSVTINDPELYGIINIAE